MEQRAADPRLPADASSSGAAREVRGNLEPDLKPGLSSTTFWMTVILEVVVLVNATLKSYGKQPIEVPPALSMLLATGLATIYVSWRHWNRRTVNLAKMEIELAKVEASAASQQPKEQ